MNQGFWEMMVSINTVLNSLRKVQTPSPISMAELLEIRSKLRTQLEALRTAISEQYSERDAYYVLFPVTAHCDELVKQIILDSHQLDWPPLQQELYQVADAGNLFFEFLDSALSKPETLFLVYEAYYFCLQDGFCGRYSGNPDRLADYLNKLRKHIQLQPVAIESQTLGTPSKRAYYRIPNYLYYGSVSLLLILVYFFLTKLAGSWQPL